MRRAVACGVASQIAAAPSGVAILPDKDFPQERGERLGEPYEPAGKRLVFTNWFYVRPGEFGWYDRTGNNVTVTGSVSPSEARIQHRDLPYGVRLVAQRAERLGPLLEPETSWEEGAGVAFTTVLKDGGMYRAWLAPFTTSGNPKGQHHFCYFESQDGLTWKRPKLGIVEHGGSRENNIVNIFGTDGGTVFIDPSAPPTERYKLMAEGPFPRGVVDAYLRRRPHEWDARSERRADGSVTAMTGGISADGLHWSLISEPLAVQVTDTQLVAYYDDRLRKYVAYTRTWVVGQQSARVRSDRSWSIVGRRSIGRTESADFRNFPLSETILEPGPGLAPSDLLYTNCKTVIPEAPDHHLMFPSIWHTSDDTTSIALATSHDGKLWHFLPGSPVFSTGPFGQWDGGCVFAHPNLVELADGRFVLPYTGYTVPHKYPRGQWRFAPGYMVWPQGRLVAIEAPKRGEFATVGIVPPGRKLRLNARTKRAGTIVIEVAALDGKPLEGRSFADAEPIVGDHHAAPAIWKGQDDLGHGEGSGIFLRLRMEQAEVFSLTFE